MVQTVTTLFSLLLAGGASGLIAATLVEDRQALMRALARASAPGLPPLPPHTHRVAGARAARIVTLRPMPLRAAA